METSENINEIAVALIKAQKNIGGATKGSSNPFFKSQYADLGEVIDACKDALLGAGIACLQPINGDFVDTMLLHESGQFIKGSTKIICAKPNDPQAQGSAITYARRYGLQSLALIPSEDDDGESAMDRNQKRKPDPKVEKSKALIADLKHYGELVFGKGGNMEKNAWLTEKALDPREDREEILNLLKEEAIKKGVA